MNKGEKRQVVEQFFDNRDWQQLSDAAIATELEVSQSLVRRVRNVVKSKTVGFIEIIAKDGIDSFRKNVDQLVRINNQEKREIVETALKNGWQNKTNTAIALHCGVGIAFVSNTRDGVKREPNLKTKEKKQMVETILKGHEANMSDQAIANSCQLCRSTVHKIRKRLIKSGIIKPSVEIICRDGKVRKVGRCKLSGS